MNILNVENLGKAYREKPLLEQASFSLEEGEKVGVIGLNGTGKSTFLKMLAGLEEPDTGTIITANHVVIRYLPQHPVFREGSTVLEAVMPERVTVEERVVMEANAKTMLTKLGVTVFDEAVDHLSGGQRKRLALVKILLEDADILLLDEPTNHLDADMSEWLEEKLRSHRGAIVMVTHDRYVLDSVTNRIVEIDRGRLYSYNEHYSGYLERKAERMVSEQAGERKRLSLLRTEIAWMQRGARARSTKQKAHIARYEQLAEQKAPEKTETLQLSSISSRMGRTTIELLGIDKAFGERVCIRDFTYRFLKGDRIGFVGPNGCGKSTMMKLIMSMEQPDAGEVVVGQTVKIGYYAQELPEESSKTKRVIDVVRDVAEYVATEDGPVSASVMLERFLFSPEKQYAPVSKLSGGERRRLNLLCVLMGAPNVLILDEPTNDLDIQTLSILEDYLDHFDGIVILVSHDRYLLDRIARRIFAYDGDGKWRQFEGGYTDYHNRIRAEQAEANAEAGQTGKSGASQAGKSGASQTGKNGASQAGKSGASQAGKSGASQAGGKWSADGEPAASQMIASDTGAKKKDKSRIPEKIRFTYAENKEYEHIDEDIAAIEARIQELEAQMEKEAANYAKLQELNAQKEAAEAELEEKMERWMYLNEKAEQIAEQG